MDTVQHVQAYLESCTRRGLAKDTLISYRGILKVFVERFPELPMDPAIIEDFVYSFKSSSFRRHGAFRVVRAFYNYLERQNDGFSNPVKRLVPPLRQYQEKAALNLAQTRQLLEYPHRKDTAILVLLLADTGCRIGEAIALHKQDIVCDDTTSTYQVKLCGKTGLRVVPVNRGTAELLLSLPGDKVFPFCKSTYVRAVKQAFTDAGLKGSAHTLRHSFVSNWYGNLDSLKVITGHRSMAMIEHYTHTQTEKATLQHLEHSPVSKLMGGGRPADPRGLDHGDDRPPAPGGLQPAAAGYFPENIVEALVELGELRERCRQLEKRLAGTAGYKVVLEDSNVRQ